jgi:hypothetical protein
LKGLLAYSVVHRALNDKLASNQTESNLKFRPQWENMNFTLFMLTFQHSVYDMETLDDFRGMVFNNGVKKTTVYSGDYVHEWDDRPYSSQYVSEVLFELKIKPKPANRRFIFDLKLKKNTSHSSQIVWMMRPGETLLQNVSTSLQGFWQRS